MDALPDFALVRATTLEDVVNARASHPDSRLLGGGTDLVENTGRGVSPPPVLVDINHVEEMRAIRADARILEIGAAVKLAELDVHEGVRRHYPVVAQAAGCIAGPTHRNMGTVGGNLCLDTRCLYYNQSEWWRAANNHCLKTTSDVCHVAPKSRGICFATFSGDLAPALLTLNAEVDLAGPAGPRTIALESLYIGYARQDQVNEDDVPPRPLPPPRRGCAGTAARGPALRRLSRRAGTAVPGSGSVPAVTRCVARANSIRSRLQVTFELSAVQ